MAQLPDSFQFSQSALQDYADCPLRFYLRTIKGQRYPAPDSEPLRLFERQMTLGERFHLLVQQHQIGIPADVLTAALAGDSDPDGENETLATWFAAYLTFLASADLPARRRAETALSMAIPSAGTRLVAKYDLLAVAPGDRAVIVDWKTTPRRPSRDYLASRWQTIVYPYVLARAGTHLYGTLIPPERITMIYWFASAPDRPEQFTFDAAADARAGQRIDAAIADIVARPDDEAGFPLTADERHCQLCVYRSYTDRGTRAGDAVNTLDDADADVPIDFDALDPIAF